jgi:arsenite-transporting ATPase
VSARILFFVGKGGVGKSTNSSLFALKLAGSGRRVLLNSIDPAHNLHDIFQVPLDSRPKKLADGLEVMETDLDEWVKRYLKETERDFRSVYKYQEAFNLHRYFRTLKYSPGLEEYAVLLALLDTLRRFNDRDYIVFDTPPTALTLKFLALPDVSLLWLRELSQFRELILKKKEIIARIRQGKSKAGKQLDPILRKIAELVDLYQGLAELLKDGSSTSTFLVLNPDELSLAESRLIWKELKRLGISIPYVILNKVAPDALTIGGEAAAGKAGAGPDADGFVRRIEKEFPGSRLLIVPLRVGDQLTGMECLGAVDLPLDVGEV